MAICNKQPASFFKNWQSALMSRYRLAPAHHCFQNNTASIPPFRKRQEKWMAQGQKMPRKRVMMDYPPD